MIGRDEIKRFTLGCPSRPAKSIPVIDSVIGVNIFQRGKSMSRTIRLILLAAMTACISTAFAQEKSTDHKSRLTGMWKGDYPYSSANLGGGKPSRIQRDQRFKMVAILSVFVREPRTFGAGLDPYLHATIRGIYAIRNKEPFPIQKPTMGREASITMSSTRAT